jgi:hypothetical protein
MLQTANARTSDFFSAATEQNNPEKSPKFRNFETQELMVNYITKFSHSMREDTVQCVLDSFIDAVQQLENTIEMHSSDLVQMIKRLHGFKEALPNWLNQRLLDTHIACTGINHEQIDAVTNHGLDQLLTATEKDLELQMQMQQSFDQSLQNFKSMLVNSGFRTKADLEKLPIAQELYRTNPANLSKLMTPMIDRLVNNKAMDWIFYRLLHTALYNRLPALYKSWEKNLRNYHGMMRAQLVH